MSEISFVCRSCDETHDGVPLVWGPDAPTLYQQLSAKERADRAFLSTDQCIVDDEHHFMRAELTIPIIGSELSFVWLVWVSQSHDNFFKLADQWEMTGRETEPPTFGWLSSSLPLYPETLNMKTMLHQRQVGIRPYVEIEPSEHPLAVEQKNGITMQTAEDYAARLLHQAGVND